MKQYELNYLVSPNLLNDELRDFQKKVENIIHQEGGVLADTRNEISPIKRNLFHSISTKLHPKTSSAYLGSLNFKLEPENLKKVESNLKLEGQVLRFLVLAKKERKALPPRIERPILEKPIEKTIEKETEPKESKEKTKKEKIKFEDIEEKLEEILDNA